LGGSDLDFYTFFNSFSGFSSFFLEAVTFFSSLARDYSLGLFYILAFSAGLEAATSGFLSAFAGFFNDYSLILLEFCSTGFYFSF
jgi:hypothetical protein